MAGSCSNPHLATLPESIYRLILTPSTAAHAAGWRKCELGQVRYVISGHKERNEFDVLVNRTGPRESPTFTTVPYGKRSGCSGISAWDTPDRCLVDWLFLDATPGCDTEAGLLLQHEPQWVEIDMNGTTKRLKRFACYKLSAATDLPSNFHLCRHTSPSGQCSLVPTKEMVLRCVDQSRSRGVFADIPALDWVYTGAYVLAPDRAARACLKGETGIHPQLPKTDPHVRELSSI
jgi:hypothetical protein